MSARSSLEIRNNFKRGLNTLFTAHLVSFGSSVPLPDNFNGGLNVLRFTVGWLPVMSLVELRNN